MNEQELVNAVIEKINVADINEQCSEIKGNSDMIFRLVLKAGEVLLHNGGEIFRVEQTMEIIANHYGVVSIDVYAVSNGIFVTM
ncbi:MAG TPA: threonine/serine exporter family protein, partial [Clostridiales bacterium]|nr:threonine/serine exporter family protein [Clostridiales bacterium]